MEQKTTMFMLKSVILESPKNEFLPERREEATLASFKKRTHF